MATKTKKKTELYKEPREKTVSVRRKEKFSHIPTEVLQNSTTKVGSILDGRTPLKGVEGKEEKLLLSKHLGIDEDHNEFGEKAKEFWAELDLKVPSEGVELDISIGDDGMPKEMIDYLTYRWLQKHKYVASSRQEMVRNPIKEFYIHDPARETKKENEQVQKRKVAYAEFIKATEDEGKMNMLLRVLGDKRPEKLTKEQKENKLESLATASPARFARIAQDSNLEIRSEIEKMVEKEILRKSGNSYFYMDELIGENLDETIGFFQNKKNSSTVGDMRAKLKELSD